MFRVILTLALCGFCMLVQAKECNRPIKRIFTGFTTTTSKIHIEHGDGYQPSVVRLPQVNNDEKIVDRILSVVLAAHLSKTPVTFRYASTISGKPATCKPIEGQYIQAVWIN